MNSLLTAIVLWLSVNFGLPPNYDHPAIEPLPPAQIAESRYGTVDATTQREVVAVYNPATRTILLPNSWTGKTPADLSVLVHELVHHLQNVAGLQYACAALREKTAYAAQEAWLALFGQSLSSAFELDPMTLKLTTECMPF